MDPDYSAQDIARCDLCKVAIVQSYCDFCHVNLCKPCIGEHISDDYSKHTIVPFQQRRSTPIYPKCETHPNKTCKFQCKDCNILLCSYCLASKQHNKDHELSKLEEIFNQKKDQIQKDREELKLQLLPAYEDIATELENKIASLDVDYNKLTTELSKHREELHREIDIAINQREREIDENKVNHLSILKKHLEEIKQLQSLMQETIHSLNEKEDSNEVTLALKTKSSAILNTIKTGLEKLGSVTCLNEEEIWTSGRTAGDIKFFNTEGVLQKTIKTKSGEYPVDIVVYSDGALVYSDWKKRTGYKLKNDQTEEIIRLQGWRPSQLCVTSSGDLLVTMITRTNTFKNPEDLTLVSDAPTQERINCADTNQEWI
ncbi:uncharacterized protein LOC111100980 [Crassostrea virginica]